MDGQFAEQTPECHLFLQGDVLVAKHQHLVPHEDVAQCLELLLRQGLTQVDAADLGPDVATEADHLEAGRRNVGRWGHGMGPP